MPEQGASPSAEDGDFNPHASMFVDGAPHAGFGGIDVLRASLMPAEDIEGIEQDDPALQWHVSIVPVEQRGPRFMVMVGDLVFADSEWFIGVSVSASLTFREDVELPPMNIRRNVNELTDIYGPWASHLLYDIAAMNARQLVAGNATCKVEFPLQTPKAHLVKWQDEDADLSPESEVSSID